MNSYEYARLLADCLSSTYLPFLATCGLPALPLRSEHINVGHRRFRVLRKLGEGGYAVVLLVLEVATPDRPHPDPEPRALKKVLVHSQEQLDAVQQEMLIHSAVQHHPNVLPLLDYACTPAIAATAAQPLPGTRPSGVSPAAAAAIGGGASPFASAAGAATAAAATVGGKAAAAAGGAAHRALTVAAAAAGASDGGEGERVALFLFPAFPDGTLAAELDRLAVGREALLPTAEVLSIFLQIARAARHMHSMGYAHRDLKPLNVLISVDASRSQQAQAQAQQQKRFAAPQEARDVEAGASLVGGGSDAAAGSSRYRCVLMDFGSARPRTLQVLNRAAALEVQEDAQAHVSAPYRSPELWDVPSPAALDYAASDVWALGCCLFHVMYGEPPFQRAANAAGGSLALAVLNCAIGWPRPPNPSYPPELHALVTRAMAAEPRDRPTAEQLVSEAEALLHLRLPDPQQPAPGAQAARR